VSPSPPQANSRCGPPSATSDEDGELPAPVPPYDLSFIGLIVFVFTFVKILTYYLAVNWMVPGYTATQSYGLQVFALTIDKEGQKSALTPTDWAHDFQDKEESVVLDEEGSKEDRKREMCQNMLRGLYLVGSEGVTESLSLVDNKVEADGANSIKDLLKVKNKITKMVLRKQNFHDGGFGTIASTLAFNDVVTVLDLSENKAEKAGGAAMASAIETNVILNDFKLNHNPFGCQGGIAIAKSLGVNTGLTAFELIHITPSSSKSPQSDFAKAFGPAFEANKVLRQVNLSENWLPARGFAVLCGGIEANETLR